MRQPLTALRSALIKIIHNHNAKTAAWFEETLLESIANAIITTIVQPESSLRLQGSLDWPVALLEILGLGRTDDQDARLIITFTAEDIYVLNDHTDDPEVAEFLKLALTGANFELLDSPENPVDLGRLQETLSILLPAINRAAPAGVGVESHVAVTVEEDARAAKGIDELTEYLNALLDELGPPPEPKPTEPAPSPHPVTPVGAR
jgi:hypothetical protein